MTGKAVDEAASIVSPAEARPVPAEVVTETLPLVTWV